MDSVNCTETSMDKKFYAACSSCGHTLGRSLIGSDSEVECPKCGAKINYKVAEKIVTVILMKPSTKRPSEKSKNKKPKLSGSC